MKLPIHVDRAIVCLNSLGVLSDFIFGGSVSLLHHGLLDRDVLDLDLVLADNLTEEATDIVSRALNDGEKDMASMECLCQTSILSCKIDIFQSKSVGAYSSVEYNDYTIKVQDPAVAIRAKINYMEINDNPKHLKDLKYVREQLKSRDNNAEMQSILKMLQTL